MKIVLIDGSPKVKGSTSAVLLDSVKGCLPADGEVQAVELHGPTVPPEGLVAMQGADAWVIACPLYVDALPGHLLGCLVQLEEAGVVPSYVYGIVNCGFYEGEQTHGALAVMANWCHRLGAVWAGGVGVGGGEAIGQSGMPRGYGPRGPVDRALEGLAARIAGKEVGENRYVSIGFPREMYRLAGGMSWRRQIRKNGGRPQDLGARPEA